MMWKAVQRYTLISLVVFVCLASVLGSGCCAVEVTAQVGTQAPGFALPTAYGEMVSLDSLRGKPVVLTFWSTGCGWCLYQMPFFQAVHDEMGDDVEIIAIDIGESSSTVREFAEYFGYNFTFALDMDASVTYTYNIRGTPTSYYIDEDGVIKDIKIGAFLDTAGLTAWLDSL